MRGQPRRPFEPTTGAALKPVSPPGAEAVGLVAGDKDIAGPRGRLAVLALGNRQRLEIAAVGEEDAGILGAEGMARLRGDGEAQAHVPVPRVVSRSSTGQHEVIAEEGAAGIAGIK